LDPSVREQGEFRYRIIRADNGAVRWVKAYGEAQFDVIGKDLRAVHFIGSIQDITEEKEREDAFAENADRLRLAIDAGKMAVWEVDLETEEVSGSAELNRLYRLPEDSKPTLDELRACYAPGERDRVRREAEEIMARGGTTLDFTVKHAWADGVEKWFMVRAELVPKRDGSGQRVIGVVGDITEAKKQEERLAVVARELRHRLMNLISVIGSISNRSWPRDHPDSRAQFQQRLLAIGKATDLMFPRNAAAGHVTLRQLLEDVTAPYRSPGHDQFTFEGPDVVVGDRIRNLAMAFHELATNAMKYGALSVPAGAVAVRWTSDTEGSIAITWQESSGPAVEPPESHGLGTTLLTKMLFPPPDRVSINYHPTGLVCRLDLSD
jgi:PAS domain S-box-containing protein